MRHPLRSTPTPPRVHPFSACLVCWLLHAGCAAEGAGGASTSEIDSQWTSVASLQTDATRSTSTGVEPTTGSGDRGAGSSSSGAVDSENTATTSGVTGDPGDWNAPEPLGFENMEEAPMGESLRPMASGVQWVSGSNTQVVDMAGEGLPPHGGGGSRVLRVDWREADCANDSMGSAWRPSRVSSDIGDIPVDEGDAVWVSARLYFPADFRFEGSDPPCNGDNWPNEMKFARFWFDDSEDRTSPMYHIRMSEINVNSYSAWNGQQTDGPTGAPPWGEWFLVEFYQRYSQDDPRPGDVKIWLNNERIFTSQGEVPLRENAASLDKVELFDYWNTGVPSDRFFYYDDLVMTKEPQNVDAEDFPFIGGAL